MRLNILIGGKAGQGINKVSQIVSEILNKYGWFTFNYRDYQSLIRGGHNFNILCISDKWTASHDSVIDGLIHLDETTLELHKGELKKDGFVIGFEKFKDLGLNLNVALAGALIKILGIDKKVLVEEMKKELGKEAASAAEKGFESQEKKFDLEKLNNKIRIRSGSQAVAEGAINSGIDLYVAYPMTPATGVMNELAAKQVENNLLVFQAENEIAVANAGIGASFTGAKTMVGTSGGGFDLMSETFSLQGQSEIPLVVYLAARPGPGTGVPTYTAQGDLDVALRAGHGEFPRVVIAPGDPVEAVENTNEAFYLSEKFKALSIVLSDKHLAESEFSLNKNPNKVLKVEVKRKVPGEGIVRALSYEHVVKVSSKESDPEGNSTESAEWTRKNADNRMKRYGAIKKEVQKFDMIKTHGKKNSKNLVIAWGSTKGVILDAIDGLDVKFLQVIYVKPLSNEIKKEMEKAKKIILIEQNLTGQLGRLIREKTGIKIENRILKYDGRPFRADELKKLIEKELK